MEKNEVLLPEGYGFYEEEGAKMLGNKTEEFNVKNRAFENIDLYFNTAISSRIMELSNRHPGTQVKILDLAGGTESKSVKDISQKFGGRVSAVNIDFAQNVAKGAGALRVQGNVMSIPAADASFDIIYSRQLLPFLLRFDRKHLSQVEKVLSEVSRVLKPGGIAFLDDEEELSGQKSNGKRAEIAARLHTTLDTGESGAPVRKKRGFLSFGGEKLRYQKFLIMRKG